MSPFIPYAESTASQQVPPPYHFPGVTVNAFIWEAQMQCVQDYCDRFFNIGSNQERGFVYKPAAFWPYATLLFLEYPAMISSTMVKDPRALPDSTNTDVPYSDRGIISQTEVFIALPVMRYGATPTKLVTDTTLEWALPFIVVGNPMSCVCGREMLGLGKLLADIEAKEGVYPDGFSGSVVLPAWPTPGEMGARWRRAEAGDMQERLMFLSVETGPTLPTFRTRHRPEDTAPPLLQSREAGWFIDNLASFSNFVDTASLGLIPTSMRTVGLKQYRDALDPEKAIYQALITCRSLYSNVNRFKFYDQEDVAITFFDRGSFQDILRVFLEIPEENRGKPQVFSPMAAFRFNADIDFDQMRVIHTFPVDRGPGAPPVAASSDLTSRWLRPWQGFFGPAQP